MELYILKNYRTRRFSRKSFDSQSKYFIVADLFRADKPNRILGVIAYWGSEEEDQVRKAEESKTLLPKSFYEPFYGKFEDVKSEVPLLRFYTADDTYCGFCKKEDEGKFLSNPDGSYKVYNSIKVFCRYSTAYIRFRTDPRTKDYTCRQISKYMEGWEAKKLAQYRKEYCYKELSEIGKNMDNDVIFV